jgi:UDP-4-amino-4,6-dideoxy-N-acetyl-beta-L-altrosamine N-acetyltransferase
MAGGQKGRRVPEGLIDMQSVTLVPFDENHLPLVLKWVNDADLRDAIGTVRPISMTQHRAWYDNLQGDQRRLHLVVLADGQAAGMVGLRGIDLVGRCAELWVYIGDSSMRRQGIGKTAVREMLFWAFETLGLHRVFIHVFAYNVAALRFFEAYGFRREGVLREAVFKRGRYWDKHVLSILETEHQSSATP